MFELIISDSTAAPRLSLIVCHRSPVTLPHVRDELDCPALPLRPFQRWARQGNLKDVPAARCASTTAFYQLPQIKLEETSLDGEADGKINVRLSVVHVFNKQHV